MIDINKVIEQALEKQATDIHLMLESKPIYRVGNSLIKMQDSEVLKNEDVNYIYKYLTKRSSVNSKTLNEQKSLDMIYEYKGIEVGVNLSYANESPVYTMKILKKQLPEYEELDLPEILRKMTGENQGLILVTGNRKSGKTTTLNALVRHINETQNKKIITLEKFIEYKHISRNSIIVQKQIDLDFSTYKDGVKNTLKEDCDVLVVEDIRNKETLDAVLEIVESGRLVIAGVNATSPINTIEKIINFYDLKEQSQIKYLLSTLLKVVISQKLLLGTNAKLELVSEVMVIDNKIKDILLKEKIEKLEFEKAIQDSKESISLIDSLANLYIKNKITLKQAKSQIQKVDIDKLNKTIMKLRTFH